MLEIGFEPMISSVNRLSPEGFSLGGRPNAHFIISWRVAPKCKLSTTLTKENDCASVLPLHYPSFFCMGMQELLSYISSEIMSNMTHLKKLCVYILYWRHKFWFYWIIVLTACPQKPWITNIISQLMSTNMTEQSYGNNIQVVKALLAA